MRKPPGAFGMPGLGGSNLLAEMKLKRSTMMGDNKKPGDGGGASQRDSGGGGSQPNPQAMLKPVNRHSNSGTSQARQLRYVAGVAETQIHTLNWQVIYA